jgi:2-succinyl-5-enolpyruvyl-6-hydroxy-3-cyclohexene-1-carboxylate synthase
VIVDPHRAWLDPAHRAAEIVVAEPDDLLHAAVGDLGAGRDRDVTAWRAAWTDAEQRARQAIDEVLDRAAAAFDGRVARDVAAGVADGGALVVASSLPVRALEWCMAPRDGVDIFSNRGVNGIDGFVSTALGIAASGRPVVALCGDLCFLHDTNGLLGAHRRGSPVAASATFVVIDNRGGGIFSFLPPRELDEFEWLFATPQTVDLVEVARSHGVDAGHVDDLAQLKGDLVGDGVRVLVVPVDRDGSVARHRELWDAVAAALRA